MAESKTSESAEPSLSKRIERYQAEIEKLVKQGTEHPNYEFKRQVSISQNDLADKLDFVKQIQGTANSLIDGERFLVIGADQREKKFYPVTNVREFDPANLGQIVGKYLDPQPQFEIFNSLQTPQGEPYVLIVIPQAQPRPILIKTEGQTNKKTHFRLGDIWIKRNTGLQPASRMDLQSMFAEELKRRVDEESESRARRRFQHFREELGSGPLSATTNARIAPAPELLVGPRAVLRRFVEEAIATDDLVRLRMMIEIARESLVDGLDAREVNSEIAPSDPPVWHSETTQFFVDQFFPALDGLVEIGLLLIKYGQPPISLLTPLVDLLQETFENSRPMWRLHNQLLQSTDSSLTFWKPAYRTWVGLRVLATYAVHRQRYTYLSVLLHRYLRMFTLDNQSKVEHPALFWPFSGIGKFPDMNAGRNTALWNDHVRAAWGSYFATLDRFHHAAMQLEFVLEFNSYLFEGDLQDPKISKIRAITDKSFAHIPDFWNSHLEEITPIATFFYDQFEQKGLPPDLSINETAAAFFNEKQGHERIVFLGGFLDYLKRWQAEVMMQNRRFPYMGDWTGKLKAAVDAYKQTKKPPTKS